MLCSYSFIMHLCDRVSRFGFLLVGVVLVSGCTAQRNGEVVYPSKQSTVSKMEWVIARHQSQETPYALEERGLPVNDNPPAWIFEEPTATREKYRVPTQPGTADTFQYSIALDKVNGEYWLIRSGGYAGRRVVFGPGVITDQ